MGWFSNAEKDGYKFNSLYLKSGDFRTEKGSIVASKDVIASEYLKIKSFPGYGEGETKLWYSQEGKEKFRSNSLYLAKGDSRTEQGSIYAAKEIHVGRYLEVQAWPGHGSGNAQLWHGRKEQDATMTAHYISRKEASRYRKVLSLHTKTCLLDVMSRLEH